MDRIEEKLGYKERLKEKLEANRIRLYAPTVSSSTERNHGVGIVVKEGEEEGSEMPACLGGCF